MSSAVEQVRSQYDQVPYTSHPFSQTAPEHLVAVAHLFGLKTPDVATSRVLELGCSSGGNLIPLAARHPGSKVLGLDLSGVQISQGQQRVAAMNPVSYTHLDVYKRQAMAMAGLPQAYLPGKSMVAVGFGGYQGEYGMAFGLSGITENGRYVYKAQASGNTSRDWGFSVGAGLQW